MCDPQQARTREHIRRPILIDGSLPEGLGVGRILGDRGRDRTPVSHRSARKHSRASVCIANSLSPVHETAGSTTDANERHRSLAPDRKHYRGRETGTRFFARRMGTLKPRREGEKTPPETEWLIPH
jgi:hypothetical protein